MEAKTKVKLDSIMDDGCLSVVTITYINYNGIEIEVGRHLDGLTPLDLEKAEKILPSELLTVVKALWTDDLKTAYQNKLADWLLASE